MEKFIAIEISKSKPIGERKVIIGEWEDVCDLDKRLWKVSPFVDDEETFMPEPLCYVTVYTKDMQQDDWYDKPIFSMADLEGLYV